MVKHLFTVEEVAEHLGIHVKTARRYIHEGRLKAKSIGKEYRITRADLEAFGGVALHDPEVPRTREVLVSSIVDISAISQRDTDRLTTLVMASLQAPRDRSVPLRVDCIPFAERGQLRINITADPVMTTGLLQSIHGFLESQRTDR